MALEDQTAVLDLIAHSGVGEVLDDATPAWLQRPGTAECRGAWPTVSAIYRALTGGDLPEVMPPREWRKVDAVLLGPDGQRRIVEFDERQHFVAPRATTLDHYPPRFAMAFDRSEWRKRSLAPRKAPGGRFARPCPPLFPQEGGRHLQRAFRDALADIVPIEYGWAPTLRIAHWEVKPWLVRGDAPARMAEILATKLGAL